MQTSAAIPPRSELAVELQAAGPVPAMRLRAVVVRRFVVPAQLASVVPRGIALEILEAPVEYGLAFGGEALAEPIGLDRVA